MSSTTHFQVNIWMRNGVPWDILVNILLTDILFLVKVTVTVTMDPAVMLLLSSSSNTVEWWNIHRVKVFKSHIVFIECKSVQMLTNKHTLKFSFHVDIGEAPEDRHDLIILLLPKESQHVSPVRVFQTDQILQRPHLILRIREGEWY